MTGRLRRDQRGVTLIELTIAMTMALILFMATMDLLGVFQRANAFNGRVNDAQDRARTAIDRLNAELRNLASPTPGVPLAVDQLGPYDLVFKAVDPVGPNTGSNTFNVRRLRYCLDTSNPASETLWRQVQTWTGSTPSMPSTGTCPSSAWPSATRVATNVTNRINGQDRPVFDYDVNDPGTVGEVTTDLYVDPNPGAPPAEVPLKSGVFLRNQNREPHASFLVTVSVAGHVILNGSPSWDPEGQPLVYAWFSDGAAISACPGTVVCDANLGTGTHTVTLKVLDPGTLEGDSTQQVTVQ